jgi:selenoprotein W-related protein
LLERFKRHLAVLELIPSGGGCFEVEVNGDLIFSKLAEGRFPDESAIIAQVTARQQA